MPLSVFPFQRVFTRDRKGFYHVFRFDIDRRLSFAFVGHGKLLMPFRRSYGIWEYTEYSMLCTMYFFLVSYRSLQCSPRWKTTWFGVRYNNNNWPCYKNGMQTTKLYLPWYLQYNESELASWKIQVQEKNEWHHHQPCYPQQIRDVNQKNLPKFVL